MVDLCDVEMLLVVIVGFLSIFYLPVLDLAWFEIMFEAFCYILDAFHFAHSKASEH